MKSILKGLAGLIILLLAIFFSGRLILPDTISAERHVVINAPPEKIFAVISKLRRFNEWSPWADLDAKTEYKFEGPDTGAGQKLSWSSTNPSVGHGSQTVTEVAGNQKVVTEIEFAGIGKAVTMLELAPVDKGTGVTWSFKAPIDGTVARWMVLIFPPKIEADFGKGLRRLKTLMEQSAS